MNKVRRVVTVQNIFTLASVKDDSPVTDIAAEVTGLRVVGMGQEDLQGAVLHGSCLLVRQSWCSLWWLEIQPTGLLQILPTAS